MRKRENEKNGMGETTDTHRWTRMTDKDAGEEREFVVPEM
jgi:hypothetical protein